MTKHENIEPARNRLEDCARQVNAATPTPTLSSDGAPSKAVLDFCKEYGFSLDYIFVGKLPVRRRSADFTTEAESEPKGGEC